MTRRQNRPEDTQKDSRWVQHKEPSFYGARLRKSIIIKMLRIASQWLFQQVDVYKEDRKRTMVK